VDGLRTARGWPPLKPPAPADSDAEFDKLAAHVRASLDLDRIHRIWRKQA
jgi:hypothetical protein